MGFMTSTITTSENRLVIRHEELVLTYSPATDDRVIGAEDGKLLTRSATSALELASEIRAWGVSAARGHGCAVVFWS